MSPAQRQRLEAICRRKLEKAQLALDDTEGIAMNSVVNRCIADARSALLDLADHLAILMPNESAGDEPVKAPQEPA